jgi:hypothetical protein
LLLWAPTFIVLVAMSTRTAQIMIRPAYGDDYEALAQLAALDSSETVPPRPLLLAEVDGVLRAALSLEDGSAIADPFFATAGLLGLLRTHAAGPVAAPRPRAPRRPRWAGRPGYAQG